MASKGDIHLEEASGQEARPQPGQGVSHTPGPWRIEGRRGPGYIISHGTNSYGDGPEGYVGVLDPMFHIAGQPSALDANAHLIAAAPDLLALARNLERWLLKDAEPSHVGSEDMRVYHLDGGVLGNLLNEARAAIAKASAQ